ncbi:hypothetical protein H0H81_007991 [Sphagnurus paluster]|uniref:Uncharacterized protein n=1 Tax=Sphagnurus paluster TaxID=117069 RepID=A0A9P7K4T4_9AGAR|nr:hypothetical protein H0H81_007991 [Sphagnurus paluster]
MKFLSLSSLVALMMVSKPTFGAVYRLTDQIGGGAFYDAFDFQAIADPTHGHRKHVTFNYVERRGTAQAQNLTFATSSDTFIMRADFKKKKLNLAGADRNSVRIQEQEGIPDPRRRLRREALRDLACNLAKQISRKALMTKDLTRQLSILLRIISTVQTTDIDPCSPKKSRDPASI